MRIRRETQLALIKQTRQGRRKTEHDAHRQETTKIKQEVMGTYTLGRRQTHRDNWGETWARPTDETKTRTRSYTN